MTHREGVEIVRNYFNRQCAAAQVRARKAYTNEVCFEYRLAEILAETPTLHRKGCSPGAHF